MVPWLPLYLKMRNASNTHSNTHFSTRSLWLVKIHMGPTKACGSHINLVGSMWILTNQIECIKKCVLECVLLAFLLKNIHCGWLILIVYKLRLMHFQWSASFWVLVQYWWVLPSYFLLKENQGHRPKILLGKCPLFFSVN